MDRTSQDRWQASAKGRGRGRALAAVAAVLALSAALAAAALAASTNFVEPNSSPEAAGDGPVSIASTDLDGDLDADLAVANQSSDDVTILRNTGTANFNQPASSPEPAGSLPAGIVAANFDGDADRDLAVSNFSSGDVTILLNTGTANFSEPPSSPEPVGGTAPAPDELAAADFDGDGDQDLATANNNVNNVTILLNDGAGDFATAPSSPEAVSGLGPRGVAAADLDGDGDQDLAVTDEFSDQVTILRNNGSANFTEPGSSPETAGDAPNLVVAADLDGDTDRDLAVANGNSHNVTILRNNGSANFTQPASSPETAGSAPVSVAAADFDLDTDQDLAVANLFGDNVTILRNNGSANFNQPASSPESVGDGPAHAVAADFDLDTDEDLAVANIGTDNVTILRNR